MNIKKFLTGLLLTTGLLVASPAIAQTTVPQGGTGVSSVPDKYILMGSSTLRLQSVSTTTLASYLGVPTSASTTNWNNFYNTPSTRITAGTNLSWSGNTLNGLADSAIRGLFSSSATGLTYTSGTGAFSLTSGYVIPLTASTTEWATAFASTTNMTPSYMRGLFSNSATGLTYNNSTGATSLTAGYNIPLTASTTNWNSFWDTPSTRITAGANCTWSTNTFNCSGGGGGATTTINNVLGPTFTFNASSTGATDFTISTSTGVINFHLPDASATARGLLSTTTQTIAGAKTFTGANAYGTPASITLTNGTGLPISTGLTGAGTGVLTALGVNVGSAGAFVVNGGALGTPSSGTLTNATGLPVSTGISGLGSNVATWLATPSSANLASAVTGETGSGALVFDTSPTLVTPILGVASSTAITIPTLYSTTIAYLKGLVADSTNATGTLNSALLSTGTSTLWVASTGSGSNVLATSPTLVTPNLGTPSAVTLTNGTGLPISTGVSGLASGIATFLATPSSANLATALTTKTGSGLAVFDTSPTLVTPILGVASSTALTISGALYGNTGTFSSTLNVTGKTTLTTASTTVLTATDLFASGNLAIAGTSNFTGKITATTASTTVLTATDLFASGNLAVTGTTNLTGKLTATTASTTILTSTGLFSSGNLNVASNAIVGGTLDVTGKTTVVNASSTALTATTLYSTTARITNASTTNTTLSGALHDSVGAIGTSGQVLQSTGTSTLWATASGGGSFIAATTTTTSVTNTSAETTLATIAIPAGTFSTNRGIRITLYTSNSRSGYGGAETTRIKFGGTTLMTVTDDPAGTPSEGPVFSYSGVILAAGATNSQKSFIGYTQAGASGLGAVSNTTATAAIDTTSSQNLTVTGQCNDGTPVCTISVLGYLIEKIQ